VSWLTLVTSFALLVSLPLLSYGDYYQCTDEYGNTAFTDSPCGANTKVKTSYFDEMGILKKYTNIITGRFMRAPSCNNISCSCSNRYKPIVSSNKLLLRSVESLPQAWADYVHEKRRYEGQEKAKITRTTGYVLGAACKLTMHQMIIKNNFHRIKSIQESMKKFKIGQYGMPVICPSMPTIKEHESSKNFDNRSTSWKICQQAYKNNYSYRNSVNSYNKQDIFIKKIERAMRNLKI
jgi:hypothetical protein